MQMSFVHGLLSLQTTGGPAWQVPPEQTSPVLQRFPSSQLLVLFVKVQAPVAGSHVSVVQGLLSSQGKYGTVWRHSLK
jgi:hypothetical protein